MSVIAQSDGTLKIACPGALDSTYNAVAYHQVSGMGFVPTVAVWSNSTALMKVEIASGLSGYLMGLSGSMYIAVSSGTGLTFVNNGNTYSHAIETGVHLIGFADGQAYYDGKKTAWSITNVYQGIHFGFGCLATTAGAVSNPATLSGGALKVHRILGLFGVTTSGTYVARIYSWMPSAHFESGSDPTIRIWQTQPYDSSRVLEWTASGSSTTLATGGAVTYGVSIEDVKAVTGCSYRDLMMQLCEDNGTPLLSTYEGPDTLTVASGTMAGTHASAFALSDISVSGTRDEQSKMSVPDDVTWKTWGTNNGYVKGDLLKGCNPKWNAWKAGINFGKHLSQTVTGGAASYGYNLFRNATGKIALEQWEGYSSGNTDTYGPFINLPNGTYSTYWYNGVPYKCVDSDAYRLPVVVASGSGSGRGDYMVWTASAASSLVVNGAWGNVIDWHHNNGIPHYINGVKQSNNVQITQVGIAVRATLGGDQRTIAQWYQNEYEGFGLRTAAAMKAKIQTGKENGEYVDWALTDRRDLFQDAYNSFRSGSVSGSITLYVASNANYDNGSGSKEISLAEYAGSPLGSMAGTLNQQVGDNYGNDTGFRLILDTPSVTDGGTAYLVRDIADISSSTFSKYRQWSGAGNSANGIGLSFTLSTASGAKRAGTSRVLVVADFYVCDASTKVFNRYTQLAGLTAVPCTPGSASDEYASPFDMLIGGSETNTFLTKAQFADGSKMDSSYTTYLHRIRFTNASVMGSDTAVPATTTARFSMYTDRCAFTPSGFSYKTTLATGEDYTPCFYKYVKNTGLATPAWEYLWFQPMPTATCTAANAGGACQIWFQRFTSLSQSDPKDTGSTAEAAPTFTLSVWEENFSGTAGNSYTGTLNGTSAVALKYNDTTGFYAQLDFATYNIGGYAPDGWPETMQYHYWRLRIWPATFTALKTYRYSIASVAS